MPTSLTGATLSRSGEGVTLNPSTPSPMVSAPQSSPAASASLSPQPAPGGISMANLFGNPSLSVTPPLSAPSPMSSPMPNLSPMASVPAQNPLGGSLAPQATPPKTPLVTATPQFTPPQASIKPSAPQSVSPPTFSQQPLPTLGQPSQPLALGNQATSPRGATSGKRNVKSGRRQSSEIVAPAPVEMDIVASADEVPKKGWGYIFSPLNIIFLILVFIIVFITLYSSKLNMVTNLENGERVLNNKKLILWSVVVTIIISLLGFIVMSAVAKRRG